MGRGKASARAARGGAGRAESARRASTIPDAAAARVSARGVSFAARTTGCPRPTSDVAGGRRPRKHPARAYMARRGDRAPGGCERSESRRAARWTG